MLHKSVNSLRRGLVGIAAALLVSTAASATPGTETSPTGGALPSGVTRVGGIVADLTGTNGTRLVAQAPASSLFVGFSSEGSGNPLLIGTQSGFDAATIAALGGGLSAASFRVTLYDGDSAPGNFDDGTDLSFLIDGTNIGLWSAVSTQQTTSDGITLLSSGTGFGNDILSTGWFSTTNAATLAAIFLGLSDGSLSYYVNDVDPDDNFYDFTQGVDGGLINVGQGPVITPPGGVPEPATWAMMLLGFGGIGWAMRRGRRTATAHLA